MLVRDGLRADFVVCGEPTDMRVGSRPRACCCCARGAGRRPPTAPRPGWATTPSCGPSTSSAASRRCPFAGESAPLFERPSINLGRIQGGDAVNRSRTPAGWTSTVRYLPGQSPDEVLRQVRALDPRAAVDVLLERPPGRRARRITPWCRPCWRGGRTSPRPPRWAATARPTPWPSSRWASRRSSSGPRGAGTTARRSSWRSTACPVTAAPWSSSPTSRRAGPRPPSSRAAARDRAHRASRRTGRRATRAFPAAAAALGLAIAAWTLWGIIGLVVAVAAGAYIYLDDTLEAAAPNTPEAKGRAARPPGPPCPASPRTLLLIGSDTRASEGDPGRSDTPDPGAHGRRARLHLDALLPARPLRADRRGARTARSTRPTAYGADDDHPRPLEQPSPASPSTTTLIIDFTGFAKLVDEVGGVYLDVRPPLLQRARRHGGARPTRSTSSRLPAARRVDALDYVRYRHTDSDLRAHRPPAAFLPELKRQTKQLGSLTKPDRPASHLRRQHRDQPDQRADISSRAGASA